MFQNTLNIIIQRNRKYKLAQTAAKMIKAYWIKLRNIIEHENLQRLLTLHETSGKIKKRLGSMTVSHYSQIYLSKDLYRSLWKIKLLAIVQKAHFSLHWLDFETCLPERTVFVSGCQATESILKASCCKTWRSARFGSNSPSASTIPQVAHGPKYFGGKRQEESWAISKKKFLHSKNY